MDALSVLPMRRCAPSGLNSPGLPLPRSTRMPGRRQVRNGEIDAIIPAVEEARRQGILADGPFPADTIFLRLNTNPFDCLVAMYHDQAQIGMKLLGFQKGVTLNGGLPVVLATPAHGTAFDIAGKGVAECGAMLHAMRLAVRLVKQGQRSDKDKTR